MPASILVTGASRGLGLALAAEVIIYPYSALSPRQRALQLICAMQAVTTGLTVWAAARDPASPGLTNLAAAYPGLHMLTMDIKDRASVQVPRLQHAILACMQTQGCKQLKSRTLSGM